MAHTLFPVRIQCFDNGHYVSNPEVAESIWMRTKDKISWYALDAEILSETSVRVIVYDIANNFSGGIGKEKHRFETSELTPDELAMVQKAIAVKQRRIAEDVYEDRLEEEKNREIEKIRIELFGK